MTKVTVILTTYNSENTLQRALDSVFTQQGAGSEFEIELLVVDDCSKDATCSILQQNNIDYMQTPRNSGGPNLGRNMALKRATGDVISFIDHDDEWLPNKTAKQLEFITKVPVVTSGYIVKDSLTRQTRNNFSTCDSGFVYFPSNETFKKKISKVNGAQRHYFGSIMIRKELNHILFEEEYGMVDFDWIARIFEQRDSIEVCEPLFIRYVDGPNLSLNENYRKNDFSYSLNFIEKYRNSYPKEVEQGSKRMFGSLARYYYIMGRMKDARPLFLKSGFSMKTILYYLTTFYGSSFVKKHFPVFG